MSQFPTREEIEAAGKACADAGVEYVGPQWNFATQAWDVLFNARTVWGSISVPLKEISAEKIYSAVFRAKQIVPEKPL
jgi:hypothetical protein